MFPVILELLKPRGLIKFSGFVPEQRKHASEEKKKKSRYLFSYALLFISSS